MMNIRNTLWYSRLKSSNGRQYVKKHLLMFFSQDINYYYINNYYSKYTSYRHELLQG